MSINIQAVIDRSEQGVTRPFFCEAEDGLRYFVKGEYAGKRALICEWIAAHIARCMGLPIPDFYQVNVPRELVGLSARDDIKDLGSGIQFGSQFVKNTCELSYQLIEQIDIRLRASILLFDYWIMNGDRALNENGGNPNILWSHHEKKAYIIDHNLAFDWDKNPDFWSTHLFRSACTAWDTDFRTQYELLMDNIMQELPVWWQAMPTTWTEVDIGFTLESVREKLWRYRTEHDTFWGVQ